ncbi:Interference hedgehog [Trichinella pseudospiralis]
MHMRTPSGSSRGLIHKELTRRLGNYQAFAMVVQIIQEKMQRVHFRLSQSISVTVVSQLHRKSAENEYDEDDLRRNLDELVRETHSTLTSKRIEWKHITSRAPWCGGYREHLVRSVKTALRKVLGRTSLDEEELATVLCGIEAQVNARPLTFVGDDISYLNALTTSRFLIGRASADAPYDP